MATDTDTIHEAIEQAVNQYGSGLGASYSGRRVNLTRSRRPCGWIEVVEQIDGSLEITYQISRAQGAFCAALRAAGICDSHWELVQS